MSEKILDFRTLAINNLHWLFIWTIIFYYFIFRLVWKIEQKRLWYNNFEWWVYKNLVDMYKFYWYPYPEIEAKESTDVISQYAKKWDSLVKVDIK